MNGTVIDNKTRILQAAQELFFSYGIRSITMDDIARHLSVSKKTLYRYYDDKDQIVHTLTLMDIKENEKLMKEITVQSKDAIDEILQSMECVTDQLSKFHP